MIGIQRQLVMTGKGFTKRIERARADVAKDDANRANDELYGRAFVPMTDMRVKVVRSAIGSGRFSSGISHETQRQKS